ncbi:MAG: MlaC/ttg2D family ABC transporter substrate-binding protein [Oceanobacter sp.]
MAFAFFANAEEGSSPESVVAKATTDLISKLNSTPVEGRTDEVVRQLVLDHIVPVIDQRRIAMSILKKYWRIASDEQRNEFIERFTELQIRTYSGAFKAFNGEQLDFKEARYNSKGNQAIVKGELIQTNGNLIPIDFVLYQDKDDKQWRIVDAVVSGLKMVNTYHDQMSERLAGTNPSNAKERIDQLLVELAEEAKAKAQDAEG